MIEILIILIFLTLFAYFLGILTGYNVRVPKKIISNKRTWISILQCEGCNQKIRYNSHIYCNPCSKCGDRWESTSGYLNDKNELVSRREHLQKTYIKFRS